MRSPWREAPFSLYESDKAPTYKRHVPSGGKWARTGALTRAVFIHMGQAYRGNRPSTQEEHPMKFSEVVEHASALLQRKGRITYRALKREFTLEDDALADLKFELITGQELAVDKDGEVLVWVGNGEATPKPTGPPAQFQP